jgi:hypothetical protein
MTFDSPHLRKSFVHRPSLAPQIPKTKVVKGGKVVLALDGVKAYDKNKSNKDSPARWYLKTTSPHLGPKAAKFIAN